MEIKDDIVTMQTQEFCDLINSHRNLKQYIETKKILLEFSKWCDRKGLLSCICITDEVVNSYMVEKYAEEKQKEDK